MPPPNSTKTLESGSTHLRSAGVKAHCFRNASTIAASGARARANPVSTRACDMNTIGIGGTRGPGITL